MCAFIVLEGPDGSGTTKHTTLLCERLTKQGIPYNQEVEPTDQKLGKLIRQVLMEKPLPSAPALQLLFSSDRAEHVATNIQPALQQGTHVICERYSLSTILYGTAAGVDTAWLTAVNSAFPTPDLTIITLPPFEVCKERFMSRKQRDGLEKVDFQKKVYELYKNWQGPNTVFVDTSGSLEDSAEQIWQLVTPFVQ